jgi:hypothetical protein
VASIPASARGASPGGQRTAASAGPAGLTGPTLPDNASMAETKRIVNPYFQCLEAHGDHAIGSKPDGLMGPLNNSDTPAIRAAQAACASLRPHPPWQELPAYNPHYNQDMAKWINCMNVHGIHVHAVPGGWTYDSSGPLPADANGVQVQCEMTAFGEH